MGNPVSFQAFILWLHLLGAVIWVGGLVFIVLVVRPALTRAASVREQLRLELNLEGRFRAVMWPAVGLVLLTGLYNVMNLLLATRVSGGSLPPTFVRILAIKIGLVVLMVVLQAAHQLILRPKRVAGLKSLAPEAVTLSVDLLKWQRLAQWLWVAIMALAVLVVLLGVTLTR